MTLSREIPEKLNKFRQGIIPSLLVLTAAFFLYQHEIHSPHRYSSGTGNAPIAPAHSFLTLRRHWTQWLCQIQDQESFYRVSFVSPEQCAQIYGEAVDTPEE
ncbi:hypothetical protein FHY25_002057 [Xanthomonas arboricola]|uniref:hypothetical protein n=1 Tax=Xanthomonas campestris TaxID=339 RepID=UPI0023E9BEE9|nr:hypothetical protein [Xanthomonas campestris]MCW2007476.1 hypothetical protein [Xanthomonas campestris]